MNRDYKSWTPEEEAVLKELYPQRSVRELSRILARPEAAVYQRAHRMGLSRKKGNGKDPESRDPEPGTTISTGEDYGTQPDGSWKGKLGWHFSAEDCLYEERMRREAAAWFEEHYGARRATEPRHVEQVLPAEEDMELDRNDLMLYLQIGPEELERVQNSGMIPYHYREGHGKRRFYRKDDADRYMAAIARETDTI